jgi:hypothetical protein
VKTIDEMERRLASERRGGDAAGVSDKFHYPQWITQFYENISRVVERLSEHGTTTFGCWNSVIPPSSTYAGPTFRQTISSVLSDQPCEETFPITAGLVVIAMRQQGPRIRPAPGDLEAQHLHEVTGVVGFDLAGAEHETLRDFFEAYRIARERS